MNMKNFFKYSTSYITRIWCNVFTNDFHLSPFSIILGKNFIETKFKITVDIREE